MQGSDSTSTWTASARLREALARVTQPEAMERFGAVLEGLRAGPELNRLLTAFAGAARLVGRSPFEVQDPELVGPDGPVTLSEWSADVAARVLLLLEVAQASDELLDQAVWAVYREGDTLEKLATVRALPLLERAERFLALSLDAGRTNDVRLFTAVACDTPYPARHYPELEWNKLVMKAAFVRAPLERIVGLNRRENPELARMALEYVEEQESAGRGFPNAIWQVIAPYPRPGAVAKMLGYARHASAEVRLGAARGLERVRQPRIASFLIEALDVESDERVRAALASALAAVNASPRAPSGAVP